MRQINLDAEGNPIEDPEQRSRPRVGRRGFLKGVAVALGVGAAAAASLGGATSAEAGTCTLKVHCKKFSMRLSDRWCSPPLMMHQYTKYCSRCGGYCGSFTEAVGCCTL